MKESNKIRLMVLSSIVLCLAFLNIFFAEIPNFSPIAATALFAGYFISDKKLAFIIPLGAIIISDFFIGFHSMIWSVYLSFILVVFLGATMKKRSILNVLGRSLLGSILFFVLTNFAVFMQGGYTHSFTGLAECYFMAIPFFKNTLAGDLLFNAALFSLFSFAELKFPSLQVAKSKVLQRTKEFNSAVNAHFSTCFE